jgi:DNA-binding CsgD family transcriptional regulator
VFCAGINQTPINGGFVNSQKLALYLNMSTGIMNNFEGNSTERNNRIISSWLELDLRTTRFSNDIHQERTPFKRVYLGKKYEGVYLTQREAECIYLLLKKMKRDKITEKLKISIRTVDGHLSKAKQKIGYSVTDEIREKIAKSSFIKKLIA